MKLQGFRTQTPSKKNQGFICKAKELLFETRINAKRDTSDENCWMNIVVKAHMVTIPTKIQLDLSHQSNFLGVIMRNTLHTQFYHLSREFSLDFILKKLKIRNLSVLMED